MKTTVCAVYNDQPAVGTKFHSSLDSLESSEAFCDNTKEGRTCNNHKIPVYKSYSINLCALLSIILP